MPAHHTRHRRRRRLAPRIDFRPAGCFARVRRHQGGRFPACSTAPIARQNYFYRNDDFRPRKKEPSERQGGKNHASPPHGHPRESASSHERRHFGPDISDDDSENLPGSRRTGPFPHVFRGTRPAPAEISALTGKTPPVSGNGGGGGAPGMALSSIRRNGPTMPPRCLPRFGNLHR
jgi:hypothetical protein